MYVNLVQQEGSIDKGKCEKGVTWKDGSFLCKRGFFFFFFLTAGATRISWEKGHVAHAHNPSCQIGLYYRGTAEIDFGAIYGPLWGPGTVSWFFLGYDVGI